MITIADLNALRASPQVAYDGYGELREAARRRSGGLAGPREIPALEALMRRRGQDWCSSVLGYPVTGGLRSISSLDADMLMVADGRGLDPPLPPWLVQWRAESAETQRRTAKIRPGETDDPPSGIWTVTKRHGEELGRVRAQDYDGAVRAARGIYAVRQYEDAHGGFGLRRLTRSEAGPGADDEDI